MENKRIKPECQLIGIDGNVCNLIAAASAALKKAGLYTEAKEMQERATHADNYDKAVAIILEYVDAY